jgi:hypothetical protein
MTTVGYGDISANTKYEALYLIAALLFACMFFSYTFGIIGMILQKLSEKENKFI